jgi:regulator of nonsense transcripts 2
LVREVFSQIRPQWKLVENLEEASAQFNEAVKQNYQTDKPTPGAEPEDLEEDESNSEAEDAEGETLQARSSDDDNDSSTDEADVRILSFLSRVAKALYTNAHTYPQASADEDEAQESLSDSEDEQIVVTRPEDEIDPEAEAEFDREFQKMMAESLDSRKNERKPVFDVPLPMLKRPQAGSTPAAQEAPEPVPAPEPEPAPVSAPQGNMMKFSLLSRRGNKQQVRRVTPTLLTLNC